MRVLVVDDHRNTRESLALGFSRLGQVADVIDEIGVPLMKPVTAGTLAGRCAGLVHSTLEQKEART